LLLGQKGWSLEIQGVIPRDFIDQLLARVSLVDVINARVPLQKAGVTYKACCPFHQEKTPSFNVNPTKQFYHCFGCGAHGDAIGFLMDYDGLSFVEAIEVLAQDVGMTVPRKKLSPAQQTKQREQVKRDRDLYDVSYAVAKFYRRQLRDHADAETAKTYLRQRGLTPEIAKRFIIGFAPPGWTHLMTGLTTEAKTDPALQTQLISLGLLVEKTANNHYDRFRNRIMFPIRNGKGQVIAFGGRVLSSEDKPKYLNSSESPIFHKSDTLYGLYEWRQSRDASPHLIIVEGYMDVVALAQYGVNNAVATLGTAITESHCQILFREVDELVFCFDGDRAGLQAAWKALELVLPAITGQRAVKFLFLAEGDDPDSTVRRVGKDGFDALMANALPLSDFWIQSLLRKLTVGANYPEGRQQLISLAQPYILQAQGFYQYFLIELIADQIKLPVWRLEKQLGLKASGAIQRNQVQGVGRARSSWQSMKSPIVNKPAMSLGKHLVRILLVKPEWAMQLNLLLAPILAYIPQNDDQVLFELLSCHRLSPERQAQAFATFNQCYAETLAYIEQQPLPDEEDNLSAMFEHMALRLADELEKSILRHDVHQGEALANLQAFLKERSR